MRRVSLYLLVFMASILVTSLFLFLLPENWKVNENSDFAYFYEPIARNILAGKGYSLTGNVIETYYPPGYPLLLASLFGFSNALSLPESVCITVFQVILTALSVVLIFYLAQKVTNTKSALTVAVLWMTYPFHLWLTKQPNSEIPFIAILFGGFAIFSSACFFSNAKKIPYLLSGFLIGIAILIRPIAILFPLILVISLFYSLSNFPVRRKIVLAAIFLCGTCLTILPWESYVYAKTGKVVLISENSSMALRGGLVFAVADESYKQAVPVPPDVRDLMLEIKENYSKLSNNEQIFSFLGEKILTAPITVIKLFGIKALRSWYATDRQSFENYIIWLQLPYLLLIIAGSLFAWKRGGSAKKMLAGIWLLTLCNWGMTILVTSTLRYMVPVIGLQFINIAQVPYFILKKVQSRRNLKNLVGSPSTIL